MTKTYSNLLLERREHTALVTLDNPPAHTWTLASLRALKELVADLNADPEIYALVITGGGTKFFSAGADLKVFADGNKTMAFDMAAAFGEAFEALSAFRGVSIAAINGYAMGGGLECALACDIRIAEEHAQMALPEASVGLLPCAGGTQHLPWLVGEGWAKRMILCGERVDAATALALAAKVARQSPSSVTACKTLIQGARSHPLVNSLPDERTLFLGLFDTQDQKEGVQAFLEKRPAEWKNG